MINRLSNPDNRNRSAAKISKDMSSNYNPIGSVFSCSLLLLKIKELFPLLVFVVMVVIVVIVVNVVIVVIVVIAIIVVMTNNVTYRSVLDS